MSVDPSAATVFLPDVDPHSDQAAGAVRMSVALFPGKSIGSLSGEWWPQRLAGARHSELIDGA